MYTIQIKHIFDEILSLIFLTKVLTKYMNRNFIFIFEP